MALQLEMTDKFGNVYENGYRRLTCFSYDATIKSICVIFCDYPSKAHRDGDPTLFFNQKIYRIGPEAQAEVRDENDNLVSPALPSFDSFADGDNTNSSGIQSTIYGFVKTLPDNAGAVDV